MIARASSKWLFFGHRAPAGGSALRGRHPLPSSPLSVTAHLNRRSTIFPFPISNFRFPVLRIRLLQFPIRGDRITYSAQRDSDNLQGVSNEYAVRSTLRGKSQTKHFTYGARYLPTYLRKGAKLGPCMSRITQALQRSFTRLTKVDRESPSTLFC